MLSSESESTPSSAVTPAGVRPRRALRVVSLIRTDSPAEASAITTRRLANIVAEWPSGTALSIDIAARSTGTVSITLAASGPAGDSWVADVRWALREIAVLSPTAPGIRRAPATVLELRPRRENDRPVQWDQPETRRVDSPQIDAVEGLMARERQRTPWPVAMQGFSPDIARILAADPGLELRMSLSPVTSVEADMVTDIARDTWSSEGGSLHSYLGSPIRMRTFVTHVSGEVPARLRALVRRWGSGIELLSLPVCEHASALGGDASALVGHAVPEGLAMVMLRLPAAGRKAFPHITTSHPPIGAVALDPVPPRPATPLRLGRAMSVSGRRTDVLLDVKDLVRHAFVEGASGAGKSTVLLALMRGLAELGCGYSFFDPHGSTAESLARILPAQVIASTTFIRHSDTAHPVPLNILTGDEAAIERAIDTFAEMMQQMYDPKHEGIVGPRWRRWFGLVALGCFAHFGERASLVHVAAVASDMTRVKTLASQVSSTHPELAHRLQREYIALPDSESSQIVSWGVSKLHPLVASQAMRDIIGTGADAVDVLTLMNERRALVVDLGMQALGVPAARMLGALWLIKTWAAMGRRDNPEQPHVLIIDEAHLHQYGALPSMLAEGRKFGLGVVVATQSIDALDSNLRGSLESNVGSFFSLRSGIRNAMRASVRLGNWPIEQLIRLPDLTAATTLSRDGILTESFTLEIDHFRRMARMLPGAAEQQRQLECLLASSLDRTWRPYSLMSSPSDADIVTSLRRLSSPPQNVRNLMSSDLPVGEPGPSFLDDWLAHRPTSGSR